MKIRSMLASVLFKLTLFVLAALGVLLSCNVFAGRADWGALRQYAVLANALCAVFYLISAIRGLFNNREFQPRIRGGAIMLLCVLAVCDLAFYRTQRSSSLTYLLLHVATLVLALIDWLLFGEKNHYRWRSPLLWMIVPNLYFLYVILRLKFLGGGCLMAFLNYKTQGVGNVLIGLATVNLFSFAIGYLFVSLDMLMSKRKKKRRKSKKSK